MAIIAFSHCRITESNPNGLNRVWEDGRSIYKDWPDGAYCPLGSSENSKSEIERVGALVLWKTHEGLCLSEREANYYDDSDFYMTIWDPIAKAPYEVMFATTRGWTYPALGSAVDATPEVVAEYAEYQRKKQEEYQKSKRRSKAKELLEQRANMKALASRHGFKYNSLRAWSKKERPDRFERGYKLLQTKVRSGFRISLQEQLVRFLIEGGKYNSPFSSKQWDYV